MKKGNWISTNLGEKIEFYYGKGLPKRNRSTSGEYPVYGSNGIVGYHTEYLVNPPVIIIGRKGAAGAIHFSSNPCWPIDTTYYVKANDEIDIRYLFYYLTTLNLESLDKSTAIPGLNRNDAYKEKLTYPNLPTQHCIVAKIEELFSELDRGVECLKKAKAQLKIYRQAVLKAAIEGKISNKSYVSDIKYITIQESSERIVDCLHSTPKFAKDGYYCVDTTCIEQGRIVFEKVRFVNEDTFIERTRRLRPAYGDILFSREGTVGTSVIVPQDTDLCLGQRMMMFRLKKFVHPKFFMYALQSPFIQKQYKPLIGGTTSPHLNIKDIRNFKLPHLDLEHQEEIIEYIDTCFSVTDHMDQAIDASLQKAEALRQSILKRAFEGQLVPEEPSSVARLQPSD